MNVTRKLLAPVLSLLVTLASTFALAQGVTVQQLPVDPAAISNSTTFWCGDGAPPHTYQCPMPNVWGYGLKQTNTWVAPQTFNGGVIVLGQPLGSAAFQNIGQSGATVPLLSTANTWGMEQTLAASTTAGASLNIPQGVAPTSPVNGDMWTTSSGFFGRINGSTVGPFATGATGVTAFNTRTGSVTLTSGDVTSALTFTPLNVAGGTMTGELVLPASATGTASFNIPQGVAPTSPVNGDMWSTSAGFFGRIAGGTVGPFGAGGGGAVSSFNTRTGSVVLLGSDVTTALTYTPLSAANNLSDVTSQSTARANLAAAPLASPALTGVPTAPTATGGTNSTQIATTAFVQTATGGGFVCPLAGSPTAGSHTASVSGSNCSMQINGAAGSASNWNANFSSTWSSAPHCVVSPLNSTANTIAPFINSISTSAVQLSANASAASPVFEVICLPPS